MRCAWTLLTMSRQTAFLAAVLMLCALKPIALSQVSPMPEDKNMVNCEKPPALTVSGHGETKALPNKATVQLGVEGQADTAVAAQEAVNNTMQKVLKQVEQLKIPKRDIQTAGLNLFPVYASPKPGQESEPPRVVGYRVSNILRIEVEDLSLVGQVIDVAMAAGANRVEGVSFELRNELSYRTRALQQAAEEAKAKARALTKALDIKLGSVRSVQEGPVNIIRPPYPLAATARAATTPTPVQPGELKIEASVSVTYDIQSTTAQR